MCIMCLTIYVSLVGTEVSGASRRRVSLGPCPHPRSLPTHPITELLLLMSQEALRRRRRPQHEVMDDEYHDPDWLPEPEAGLDVEIAPVAVERSIAYRHPVSLFFMTTMSDTLTVDW